ncbi:hypothetical protein N8654_03125 [Synechococcus sp. AH-601-B19]|nr:hypothetical protein [Synechococcus sp. AH-601-B19]
MPNIFDHRWDVIAAMEPDEFATPTAEEVLEKATSWAMSEEYAVVLRVRNKKTGKVKESAYKRIVNAHKAVNKLDLNEVEISLYDDETIHSNYKHF